MRVTIQDVLTGANRVLVDFHSAPLQARVHGLRVRVLKELPHFLEDVPSHARFI